MGIFKDFKSVRRAETPDFVGAARQVDNVEAGNRAHRQKALAETLGGATQLGGSMIKSGNTPGAAMKGWGNLLRTGSFGGGGAGASGTAAGLSGGNSAALASALPEVAGLGGTASGGLGLGAGGTAAGSAGLGGGSLGLSSTAAGNALASGLGANAAGLGVGSGAAAAGGAAGAGAGAAGAGGAGALAAGGAANFWNPVGWAALAAAAAYGLYSSQR